MKHAFALRMNLGDPGTKENPQYDTTQIVQVSKDLCIAMLAADCDAVPWANYIQ